MGPALWPQCWELLYSHPIGMKVKDKQQRRQLTQVHAKMAVTMEIEMMVAPVSLLHHIRIFCNVKSHEINVIGQKTDIH